MPEESDIAWRHSDTFVVKVFQDAAGALTGVVQHVRTGERQHFEGLESLVVALGGMTGRHPSQRTADETAGRDSEVAP